jgi:hypothetical protein
MKYIKTFFKVGLAGVNGVVVFQLLPVLISSNDWIEFVSGIFLGIVLITFICVIVVNLTNEVFK